MFTCLVNTMFTYLVNTMFTYLVNTIDKCSEHNKSVQVNTMFT